MSALCGGPDWPPTELRCASVTTAGKCQTAPTYRLDRGYDRTDYACGRHLGQLVKARLRGVKTLTVERLR